MRFYPTLSDGSATLVAIFGPWCLCGLVVDHFPASLPDTRIIFWFDLVRLGLTRLDHRRTHAPNRLFLPTSRLEPIARPEGPSCLFSIVKELMAPNFGLGGSALAPLDFGLIHPPRPRLCHISRQNQL
jgi:hypothetical protein